MIAHGPCCPCSHASNDACQACARLAHCLTRKQTGRQPVEVNLMKGSDKALTSQDQVQA